MTPACPTTGTPTGTPVVDPPRPELPLGLYRHTKGDLYEVLGLVQDSTNGSPEPYGWMVHYRSLHPPPHRGGVYVRRHAQFVELVPWPDGQVRPRFILVGAADGAVGSPKGGP